MSWHYEKVHTPEIIWIISLLQCMEHVKSRQADSGKKQHKRATFCKCNLLYVRK